MFDRELDLLGSAFEWRRRRSILPLENFDFPGAHERTDFDRDIIGGLTSPRVAGSSYQMSPEEIRDAIRGGNLDEHQNCATEHPFAYGVVKRTYCRFDLETIADACRGNCWAHKVNIEAP